MGRCHTLWKCHRHPKRGLQEGLHLRSDDSHRLRPHQYPPQPLPLCSRRSRRSLPLVIARFRSKLPRSSRPSRSPSLRLLHSARRFSISLSTTPTRHPCTSTSPLTPGMGGVDIADSPLARLPAHGGRYFRGVADAEWSSPLCEDDVCVRLGLCLH